MHHLKTIHASAQYALAEATSGDFLLSNRGDLTNLGGIVRKSNCKYSAPSTGSIFSRVKTDKSTEEAIKKALSKGSALLTIDVELVDINEEKTLSSYQFMWMIAEDKID